MEELMEYFRKSGRQFGNPEVIELEKPAAFDLRWNSNPPLSLRWTWADPYAVRCGNSVVRYTLIEMVWRLTRWQQYPPIKAFPSIRRQKLYGEIYAAF
jgi:hypothetical protein